MFSTFSWISSDVKIGRRIVQVIHFFIDFLQFFVNHVNFFVFLGILGSEPLQIFADSTFFNDILVDVVADVHDAAVVNSPSYLFLIDVFDFLLSIKCLIQVDIGEWVILWTWQIWYILVILHKAHHLLELVDFNAAPFLVKVVEDLIKDFEDSASNIWMKLFTFLLWQGRLYLWRLNIDLWTSVLLNLMFNHFQYFELPLSVSDLVLHAKFITKIFGLIAFVYMNLFRLWLLLQGDTNHKF